jgi:Flp pilus assembly protein TadG
MRHERGTAMLEVALTLPLVLLISVSIFEFGRLYQTWEVMTNAAREGARVAILPNPSPGGPEAVVRGYLRDGGLKYDSSVAVSVTPTTIDMGAAGSASASTVTVNYPFTFIMLQPVARLVVAGSMTGAPITMTVSAEMRNETQD